jgi:hypothetical protein
MKKKVIMSAFILIWLIALMPQGTFASGKSKNVNDFKLAIAKISSAATETFNSDEVSEQLILWLQEQGTIVTDNSVIQFVPATQNIETFRGDSERQGRLCLFGTIMVMRKYLLARCCLFL